MNLQKSRNLFVAHTRGNLHLLQHFQHCLCDRRAARAPTPPEYPSGSFRCPKAGWFPVSHFKGHVFNVHSLYSRETVFNMSFPLLFSWIALPYTLNLPCALDTFWNLSLHLHSWFLPWVFGCQASQLLQCIILFFSSGQAHMLVTDSKHIVWHHSTCPLNLSSQLFVTSLVKVVLRKFSLRYQSLDEPLSISTRLYWFQVFWLILSMQSFWVQVRLIFSLAVFFLMEQSWPIAVSPIQMIIYQVCEAEVNAKQAFFSPLDMFYFYC